MVDPAQLALRPGRVADAEALATCYHQIRAECVPQIPPSIHDLESIRTHMAEVVLVHQRVTVVEAHGELLGFSATRPGFLESLYLARSITGHGVGTRLLDLAKARAPKGLECWAFQSNHDALRFYARHGFIEVERTDGAGNEEHAPDVRLRWAP